MNPSKYLEQIYDIRRNCNNRGAMPEQETCDAFLANQGHSHHTLSQLIEYIYDELNNGGNQEGQGDDLPVY